MLTEDRKRYLDEIETLTHEQMANLYRNARAGHPYFTDDLLYEQFMARFNKFGGMTTVVSKKINW